MSQHLPPSLWRAGKSVYPWCTSVRRKGRICRIARIENTVTHVFSDPLRSSTPTAPTNQLSESSGYEELGSNITTGLQLARLVDVLLDPCGVIFNRTALSVTNNVAIHP